jgi:hypothetical protein
MHQSSAGSPIACLVRCHGSLPTTKKPVAKVATGTDGLEARRSFSDLFNVAASRPAKSPRDKPPLNLMPSCVNWPYV